MWQKILTNALVILLSRLASAIAKEFKEWREDQARKKDEERRKRENQGKADDYENSSVDDSTDDFGRMP